MEPDSTYIAQFGRPSPYRPVSQSQVIRFREDGEDVFQAYADSFIVQKFLIYPKLPFIGIKLNVNWREPHRMLKISVPTTMSDAKVTCGIPYDAIERAADGTEHVGQRWTLHESEGYGVGLINTGQYGFDSKDGELRLSLVRSAGYCHGGEVLERDRAHRFMDIGEHEIMLGLTFGESGTVLEETIVAAQEMNVPAFSFPYFPVSPGDLPTGVEPKEPKSFLSVTPATVVLGALKQAEDGEAMILRLHESAGRRTDATATFEDDRTISLAMGPYELKSFRLTSDGEGFSTQEVNLLEE